MVVTVTLRETYDLSTKPDKMTLIGVHTPTKNIIQRLYPGFCEQYKMVKILHQNVRLASAARLPVDPLGVGLAESGQVSPEDMFNPILYKAVSNQSLSNLEYRIRGLAQSVGTSIDGESVTASNENVSFMTDEFQMYYTLLSNTRGWKVAHPQSGLSMRKLRPLVFEKWYNEGVNRYKYDDPDSLQQADSIPVDGSTSEHTSAIEDVYTQSMRGRPHRMPAFNTKYLTGVFDGPGNAGVGSSVLNGMGVGSPANNQSLMPDIPLIFTGLILVPPSKTTVLYYRMVVETVIQFFGVQTMDEIANFRELSDRARFPVYWNDYRTSSKDTLLKNEENTVSVSEDASIKKIMEA